MYTAITAQSKMQEEKLKALEAAAKNARDKFDEFIECFGEYTEGQKPHTELVEAFDRLRFLLP